MVDNVITPSPVIESVINQLTEMGLVEGINMARQRADGFGSDLEAVLTGIALDPLARPVADQLLDNAWQGNANEREDILSNSKTTVEVVVGSGFHAAVYAATRVRMGFPRPLVLERNTRVGGVFAMTARPTFYLNSRNRPGGPGLAGDLGASLNHLPGGIIQATNVGMGEYQTNADMAFVIRATLAQYADVIPETTVKAIDEDGDLQIENYGGGSNTFFAGRVILARGLGDARGTGDERAPYVVSFTEFMQRMAQPWPLRGLRRVAVVGGGDSGKCAVESLLGLAPQPYMACAALDHVERVDWFSADLPNTCEAWQLAVRGRYQGIGRYLRSDAFGVARLRVVERSAVVNTIPGAAVIDGRSYDLVVLCTGSYRQPLEGANTDRNYYIGDEVIAKYDEDREVYRVGPEAGLAFDARERQDGIGNIPGNSVAMFRLGTKTALLAATLPSTVDIDD